MRKIAVFLIVAFGVVFSGTIQAGIEREDIPELNTVQLLLDNGMKVYLKKTSSKEDISIRLTALGGYSSLPPSERASGKFASQIAMRSGIGPYHFDQLHALFYDRSIEFDSKVLPFCRYIDGSAYATEMDSLLNITRLFFTEHHFTQHSFQKVLEKAKEQIGHRTKYSSCQFEDSYLAFATGNYSFFKPMTIQDIENANFQQAKNFFDKSFRDPSEYVCVIVGSFNIDHMVSLVEKHLGQIPKPRAHHLSSPAPDLTHSSKGIRTKIVKNIRTENDAMTRVTLPVQTEIHKEDVVQIDNLAHLIKLRLKKVLRERYGSESVIISVSAEYPFYPCLCSPWINIQYHTHSKLVASMEQTIIAEMKNLQKNSVTDEEIATMIRKFNQAQKERERDNSYWVLLLSNYGLWNWDVKNLSKDLLPISDRETIKENLKKYLSLENYSIITAS